MVGLGLIYASIFIFRPEITAPALNLPSDGPPIIPFYLSPLLAVQSADFMDLSLLEQPPNKFIKHKMQE